MELFSIVCPTCQARLKVRDEAAIGHILACPKCGSMVNVEPPAGWQPTEPEAATEPSSASAEPINKPDAAEPDMQWAEASERRLQRRLLWIGAPLLLLLIAAIGIYATLGRRAALDAPEPGRVSPTEDLAGGEMLPVDRRWIPVETKWLVHARVATLAREAEFDRLQWQGRSIWSTWGQPLFDALQCPPEQVRGLTAAIVDGDDWRSQTLWVIDVRDAAELLEPLEPQVEEFEWQGDDVECVRIAGWPHPVCRISSTSLVSGPIELLQALAAGESWADQPPPLAALLPQHDESALVTVLCDAEEMATNDPLGNWPWCKNWLEEQAAWPVLRERTAAIRLTYATSGEGEHTFELAVAATDPAEGEVLRTALAEVLAVVETETEQETTVWLERIFDGAVTPHQSQAVDFLRRRLRSAVADDRLETADGVISLQLPTDESFNAMLAAWLTVSPRLEAQRLAAARTGDEENQSRLAGGLASVAEQEGAYPVGAAGAVQLPPKQRLSWIASLLPAFGHPDWHAELNFRRPWNDARNQEVTRRSLPLVVNPALGPQSAEGYPATNYVGVSGVGPDAGELPSSDPRAGLFNFHHPVTREQITAGQSQTLATLGVTRQVGPWSAGGAATVRPLTEAPYVNGPDGFGSGQPDGMFAGMADGSVRFLSRDIDPLVLERMASIHGPAVPSTDVVVAPPPVEPDPVEVATPPEETQPPADEVAPSDDVVAELPAQFEERLGLRLSAIEFDQITLAHLVEMVSQLTGVAISVDGDAVLAAGVPQDTAISIRRRNATAAEVLRGAVAELGLAYRVAGEGLVITAVVAPEDVQPPAE